MELQGKVVKGMGVAKNFVKMVNDTFLQKTGMDLYNGTLNLELEKPYMLNVDFIIKKEEYGGTQNLLVQKCQVDKYDSYIIRAEKNNTKNRRPWTKHNRNYFKYQF